MRAAVRHCALLDALLAVCVSRAYARMGSPVLTFERSARPRARHHVCLRGSAHLRWCSSARMCASVRGCASMGTCACFCAPLLRAWAPLNAVVRAHAPVRAAACPHTQARFSAATRISDRLCARLRAPSEPLRVWRFCTPVHASARPWLSVSALWRASAQSRTSARFCAQARLRAVSVCVLCARARAL